MNDNDILARLLAEAERSKGKDGRARAQLCRDAVTRIVWLERALHDLGSLTDSCTFYAIGRVCEYCECPRRAQGGKA